MKNIMVYPEALQNAACELKKRSAQWAELTDGITSEECRGRLKECGNILEEYASLLEKISSEYSETGKSFAQSAGEIYEQI